MFKILERFYGRDDITFTFISDEFNGITRGADGKVRPIVARTYNSFSQAALENGQSRIDLGVHWGFDRDEGIKSGGNVANYVFLTTSCSLRPENARPGRLAWWRLSGTWGKPQEAAEWRKKLAAEATSPPKEQ